MIASFGKLILGAALFGGFAFNQAFGQGSANSVPANTLKAFQATSGGAAVTWMPGPNKSYEASFVKEGQKMVYVYDQEGLLQQKKIVATVASFPANVSAAVSAAYPKTAVDCAYKVVNRTNQKFYEVQVANAAGVERMRFDLEGKPLGKTSLAASQPAGAQPVAVQATAPKPVAPSPQPVATKPAAQPTATQPVATKPAVQPVPTASKPVATSQPSPTKASPPVAMRGESATTTKTATVVKDDLIDDDLGDLLDDEDMDDLLDEDDDSWDDVDLGDDLDDDSDLLDGSDDLDDGLDLDDLDEDDDDLL